MGGNAGRKIRPTKAKAAIEFAPDAYAIRTTDKDGRSHGGFMWPQTIGAIVTAPDWNSEPVCGGGLHGLLDGIERFVFRFCIWVCHRSAAS